MGLLSGLGGLMGGAMGGGGGMESGMFGLLPMLLQQKQQEKPTGLQAGMQNLANDPFLANNLSMMTTGQPQMSGMGGGTQPPQGGPMGGGLAGAFSGNPQFQQQLQAMQQQRSPGFQGPHMQMPQNPMSTSPAPTGRNVSGIGAGNPMNNYGMSIGDPLQQYLMRRMGQQGG